MVRSGRRTGRPASRSPSNACGEVTSWTRCRSMYRRSGEPSARRTTCASPILSTSVWPIAPTLARVPRPRFPGLCGFQRFSAHTGRMAVVSDVLRRDVRLLGDLLGRVLVEQEGDGLLEDVERVRALSRAARDGGPRDELRAAVAPLPLERQTSVLRAFALYFQLANVAEQQHRIRRRGEYAEEGRVGRESLDAAFEQLAGEVPRVSLGLVLTAHPTEAARRTVLAAHVRIAALLEEDDPHDALLAEITGVWQADEVRTRRPRVVDEIRNGHWFFEQSLIDAAERLLANFRRRVPDAPVPFHFGTWIGGDADGNPNTSVETMAEA